MMRWYNSNSALQIFDTDELANSKDYSKIGFIEKYYETKVNELPADLNQLGK